MSEASKTYKRIARHPSWGVSIKNEYKIHVEPSPITVGALIAAILIIGFAITTAIVFASGFRSVTYAGPQVSAAQYSGPLSYATVSATGFASEVPSQAVIYLTINGTGATTQAAVANITSTLNRLNSTLAQYLNGNSSLITTQYFNVYKVYNVSAYAATESLLVTIPQFGNASSAISSVSAIPNVYISQVSPSLSKAQMTALRSQAITSAMQNASSQAIAALGVGTQIGIKNVTVSAPYIYPFPAFAAGALAKSPNVYAGVSGVTESVTVVFYKTNQAV